MPRPLPEIYIDVIEKNTEPTEDEIRRWVRATEILLRIKARRDKQLVAPGDAEDADTKSRGDSSGPE